VEIGCDKMISFDEKKAIFYLDNGRISMVLAIVQQKYVIHRYFGAHIRQYHESNTIRFTDRGLAVNPSTDRTVSLGELPLICPTRDTGDYRIPALTIQQASHNNHLDLEYRDYQIITGKPKLSDLPATYVVSDDDAQTLRINLEDLKAGVRVAMYYTIFKDLDIIAMHQEVTNVGQRAITIQNCQSLSIDFTPQKLSWLSLYGAHINEANRNQHPIYPGIQKIESVRGASSPQHQPFFALLSPKTTEYTGVVYGFHLVYSGNFMGQVEQDQYGNIRAQLGLNTDTFDWRLAPNETFVAPEAIMNYSTAGLNGMSQNFHQLYQDHLVPRRFSHQERPILINTWEAMYFAIDAAKCEALAQEATDVGIELFVLDDGWFVGRNDDTTSLGDWSVDQTKLPHGIGQLADTIKQHGLSFGLWFEPEMISRKSNLYRQHPDWCLHVPNYEPMEGRNQLVLDLTRPAVQDYLIQMLRQHLSTGKIDYIKWDMNRHMSDVYSTAVDDSQQGEVWHRYILGLYHVLEVITNEFPTVLFEGCSSGGGRFDPGMLYYMPQTWTSDNTDAPSRVVIQDGYSLLYPPITMAAHVSAVPNHQVGRTTDIQTRFDIARFGNLGYELDLTQLSADEKQQIKQQTKIAKKERQLTQFGRFYRLVVTDDNYTAWLIINENRSEFNVLIYSELAQAAPHYPVFKLNYLDPNKVYQSDSGEQYGGDELMNVGLTLPRNKTDFHTVVYHFKSC